MRRHFSIVLVTLLLLALVVQISSAQQPAAGNDISDRIVSSIIVNGHSMEYLHGLADGFGARLTGSSAYNRAAEWAAGQFRAAGIKNVRLEPFTLAHGWNRGWAHARMVAPLEKHIFLEAQGWSPSTPAGGVKGEVVIVKDISSDAIKSQTGQIRGKIALLNVDSLFSEGEVPALVKLGASYQLLKDAGALAMMWPEGNKNNVHEGLTLLFGGRISPLPSAVLGMEDTKLISRFLEKGPVTIEFEYQNQVSGPIPVNNVIAEIPGSEQPHEWIIIGAHLDSWDLGTGAQDNGTGSVMVLEAARAIAALGKAPRRSIRFALWGGEEEGLLGSAAYVHAHAAELGKCVAVLNTDNGAGHPRGWKVEGRKDLADALRPFSNSHLMGLSGDGLSMETTFDTDHGYFIKEGIPGLDLWVDMEHYGEVHHKPSDTVDKVDAHNLTAGAAIVAVTAYYVADRQGPIAPHIDLASAAEILKKGGQEGVEKLFSGSN